MERPGSSIACTAAICGLALVAGTPLPLLASSGVWEEVADADSRAPLFVRLKYATFDPLVEVPAVPGLLRAPRASQVFLVQFRSAPTEAMRREISDLGGTVQRFLTDNTHVVRMPGAAARRVALLPEVRWVGSYHPAYRLEDQILQQLATDVPESGPVRYSIELFERGASAQVQLAEQIRAIGGSVELMTSGFRMEASLDRAQLLEVVRLDAVNYIDPAGAPGGDMDVARQLLGVAPVLSGAGFTGQGVRGAVVDMGLDEAHPAFLNPAPLVQCAGVGTSPLHGTAVYGIIFGSGLGQPAATGMLPDREQGIFCLWTSVTDPYQSVAELIDAAGPYRAVFRAQALGSVRTQTYSTISAQMDDLFFSFDLLACQSMGAVGASARPEAWAKNVLSIGGVLHGNSLLRHEHTGGSSAAALDGRMKPDVAGISDGVLTTAPAGQFEEFNGSSAAAAMIAGASGLVFQMWHEGVWPGHGGGASVFDDRPAQSTARALLINSAYQYDWTAGGPNGSIARATQGWGMPDLEALHAARAGMFIIDEREPVAPLQVRSYTLYVPPGQPMLKATMVYLDPPGNPAAAQARINDLNLRVIAPDQTAYWGNHGLRTGVWSAPGGVADGVNVAENVFIETPAPGFWTVEIIGTEIVQDAHLQTPELDAAFALVVSGVGCYANCDQSTTPPILNVDDFTCFINEFAGAQGLPHEEQITHYANCDGSTVAPVLNVDDFTCFINAFAAGCP